ncbi:hypothetical protein GCM10023231_33860 [Olivibacter ginsenosidimutans]|uniref:DUF4469 domain-containing protein n=1 Tax=Olivibacter ginsenosidimutans TaxID=1176537 RepID=A0ABP9C194_9SPHI
MEFFFDKHTPKKQKEPYGKLASQQKMRLAMTFLHPLRPIINESWAKYGEGKKTKAFGQALRKVIQDAIEGNYPDQRIIPDRVLISMGTVPLSPITDVVRSEASLEVYFENQAHPMAKDGDEVTIIAYSPDLGIGAKNDQICSRKDGRIEVELPPQFEQGAFHAYLFFRDIKKNNFSKSYYLGYFEPLI